jgi:peptidoglycan/LPS O-acetylase OafA/YrhL
MVSPVQPYRPGRHFAPLDGLRGAAILFVLLDHFKMVPRANLLDQVIGKIAGLGVSGVDLFFVLSGFLITGILLDAKGGPNYFLSFYMRRTLRIFPLYYAYLAAMLLLLPLTRSLFHTLIHETAPPIPHQAWIWLYGSNIAVSIFPDFVTPGFEHLWSLAVEEQFYLVWPMVVLLASRRWLVRICIGMVLIAPVLREICWLFHLELASTRLMPSRMDALALGGLVALAVRNAEWTVRLRQNCNAVIIVTGALVVALIAWRGTWDRPDLWVDTLGLSIIAIFYAALLVKVLAAERSPMGRFFDWPFLRNIGKYSYGIYVLHVIAAHLIAPVIYRYLGAVPLIMGSQILQQAVLFVLLAIPAYCMAWASWHGFEKWFLLLKAKFPYREKKASAIQASHS